MTRTKHTSGSKIPYRRPMVPKTRVPLLSEDTKIPEVQPVEAVPNPTEEIPTPPLVSSRVVWFVRSIIMSSFGTTETKTYGAFLSRAGADARVEGCRRDKYIGNPDSWISKNGAWFGELAHPNGTSFYTVSLYIESIPWYD